MARIDFSYLQIGHVPLLLIVLYYALILFAAFVHLRRPILKRGLCTALAMAVLVLPGPDEMAADPPRPPASDLSRRRARPSHPGRNCPAQTNLLFDAGSLYGKDVGARIVIPSWTTSESAVCTPSSPSHHDVDHINGIPEVVDLRRVDRVYLGDTFFDQSPTAADDGASDCSTWRQAASKSSTSRRRSRRPRTGPQCSGPPRTPQRGSSSAKTTSPSSA